MVDNTLDDLGKAGLEGSEKTVDTKTAETGKSDDANSKDEPKKDDVNIKDNVELTDEQVLKFVSEKTGREIDSFDKLTVEKIVEKEKEFDYSSEQVKAIDDFVKTTGRPADDWFRTQATDYNKLSSEQLYKQNLKAQFPDLSPRQIDAYFNDKFHLDTEAYDEDEVELAGVKLEMESRQILSDVLAVQSKYREPKAKEQPVETPKESPKVEKPKANPKKQEWVDSMKQEVSEYQTMDIGGVEIKLNDDLRDKIIGANSNLEDFFQGDNFKNEKGELDTVLVSKIVLLAQEGMLDKVIGNIDSNAAGRGKEGIIENRKNLDLPGHTKKPTSEMSPEELADIEEFKNAMKEAASS